MRNVDLSTLTTLDPISNPNKHQKWGLSRLSRLSNQAARGARNRKCGSICLLANAGLYEQFNE